MVELERIEPEELLAEHRAEVAQVWTWVTRQHVDEILPRHAGRSGFRFIAARTPDRRLAGFGYGYYGAPGQWWHDIVAGALEERERGRWLAPGHFELVELHVRPELRGREIGGRLHDAVLTDVASPTAVLSTQVDNRGARRFYERRGWQLLVPELRFGPSRPPFVVMGLELEERRAVA